MADTDTPHKVEQLDSDYPMSFLECRSVGHQWKVVGFYHQMGEVVRALFCPRCRTDRHDRWTRSGERLGNTYTYSDGYGIGNGGASTYEVRREVLNRVTVYDSADDMSRALLSGKSKPRKKAAG